MATGAQAADPESDTARLAEAFSRDGFAVAAQLFQPDEVAAIRDTFMAQAADGPVPGLSDSWASPNGDAAADPLVRYPRMMHPHAHPELTVGPLSLRYLLDHRLYARLSAIMGEEPIAAQTMFYFKPPGARGQALHQDNFYLRVRPGTCYAAWVAIDDADPENGGLEVVPGSHRMEIACPGSADPAQSFTTDYVPVPAGLQVTPLPLKAGDVLFFNGSLIHGSTPNSSTDRFRRAFICHYVPRGSEEMSRWYRALAFDGAVVPIAETTGGGPCGTTEASGPH
jgi:ectoine hydroxylase-related dioxygenase (phytanoyl-CoA dioxygenase family)